LSLSEKYRIKIKNYVDFIKLSGKPVVIFGAGRAGWYIMKVLEYLSVPIAAFSDNNPAKQNLFCDYRVFSPGEIYRMYPDALVFSGIFVPTSADAVLAQFQEIGIREVHYEMPSFLFYFLISVAGRVCNQDILAESIRILFENYKEGVAHYGSTKDNYFVSPYVTSVITQKCSLRCRDCAQLIPYYRNPVNYPVDKVISDLKKYAGAFDVVPEISLHGGEPFLHPDIAEICRAAAAIPNIVFISFITNGTILPKKEVMLALASSGADVHQSGGYGKLSKKQKALTLAFQKHGIYSDILYCSPTEMWVKPPPFRKLCRPDIENDEIYRKCISTNTCCQIMGGELHRCALSMHGMHQGLFPGCGHDFVRLDDEGVDKIALAIKIREFMNRDRALSACDYCDPAGGTLVPPAIQLHKNWNES